MQTLTATDARSDLFNLVKEAVKGHFQTRISSREGNAILLSEEDYESLLETAELLSTPGLKSSIRKADMEIKKGHLYSFDEVFKE